MDNFIKNKSDFINSGEGYSNVADFSILTNKISFNFNILKQDAIIVCKTDFTDFLFDNIKFSNKNYVLVTHYSDYFVDNARFSKRPPCIKKWYAFIITTKHPDLIRIPIGFGVHRDEFQRPIESFLQYFYDNIDRLFSKEKDNETVYCNFTIDNIRPPRHQVMNKIMANGVKCYTPLSKYTDTPYGKLTFPEYCEDMAGFKFVASPPGNGIDCHRTWEALYFGCIPIVIKNLIYEQYNLPILQVNDYSEVTNELLENYLKFYNTHEFNYEPTKLSYWSNRMREDLKLYTNKTI